MKPLTQIRISRRSCASFLYRLVLVMAPPIAGLLWLLSRPASDCRSFGEAVHRFFITLQNSGMPALFMYVWNYLASFGIIIVLSLVATRWWNAKRVLCFWGLSLVVVLLFSYSRWFVGSTFMLTRYQAALLGTVRVDHWTRFLIGYPAPALPLGLALGWLVSLSLRPAPRYWLSRGMCPKCQYDLRGKTDLGCPECGWNRPPPAPAPATKPPA